MLGAWPWTGRIAFAEQRCQLETPPRPLDALLASVRERKRIYVESTPEELHKTRLAVDLLLDAIKHARPLKRAAHALAAVHLQLVLTELGDAPAVAVIEEPNHRQGRGIFIWRCGAVAEERIVQVPHSFFDEGTLPIGRAVAAASARALFVNSVHRYPGGVPPKQASEEEDAGEDRSAEAAISDLAHQTESTWQVMTASALDHFSPCVVLQVHGFADRIAAARQETGMVVSASVASAGKQAAEQLATRLGATLNGIRVCLYPRDTRVLGGSRNAQAKLVAAHPPAIFLHLEIARAVRRRLTSDEAFRDAFVSAVWGSKVP
jgi:hypothetical protein